MNKNVKRILTIFLILIVGLLLGGCEKEEITTKPDLDFGVIYEEHKLSFNYFWETANTSEKSDGYGLIRDRFAGNPSLSSIAAVGFGLASLPSGVENEWISKVEGEERALKTLQTVYNLDHENGFFYHFINMETGKRSPGSEISIIDTALLVAGAIVAGEYFGGDVLQLAESIYFRINWKWYVNPSRNMFYMGYKPEEGFSGAWDHISEQLILYVLSSGSPSYQLGDGLYKTMKSVSRTSYTGTYISKTDDSLSVKTPFVYTYNGSLFQYQFSHAFVDFRNIVDEDGTNWFDNSVLATKAHYAYVQDEASKYNTYGKNSWGLSAGDGPLGYLAFGGGPAKNNRHNGTIAPYAAIASINYMTEEAVNAANYFRSLYRLWGPYGFKDTFNLGPVDENYNPTVAAKTPWYASDYIGIDKGITLLMIENYRSELIWDLFMSNQYIQDGLRNLGFTSVNTEMS